MMNADGSGANLVYNNSNAYDWGAVWSPDSRYVAFTSDVAGQDEVYLLELDSGGTTRLTFEGGMYPSWVP
jgi:Tol biopolymer transport system component